MEIAFSKIHGLGNDFIAINELNKEIIKDKGGFAKRFCDRHFGVGADGVLFLCKSNKAFLLPQKASLQTERFARPRKALLSKVGKKVLRTKADFRMRIFNSDGSEAENCVNGLRCVALQRFLLGKKKKKKYSIETLAGLVNATIISFAKNSGLVEIGFLGKKEFKGRFYLDVDGQSFEYFSVDVGNPHAVFFLKDPVDSFPVEQIGHKIEYHKMFAPARTNAEFVNAISPTEVKMRVHERGACETQACGSGSIAIVIAGVNAGVLDKKKWVSVRQPGGTLEINFGEKNLFLRGSAEIVFSGTLAV